MGGHQPCGVWCAKLALRWVTIANKGTFFGGNCHERLEESGGAWRDRLGDDSVYEKKISGGRTGDGSWLGGAGRGVSGEVRESTACTAGILRTRDAGDGYGRGSPPADFPVPGAGRRGGLGGNLVGKQNSLPPRPPST